MIAFAWALASLACEASADAPALKDAAHGEYVYLTSYQTLARVRKSGGPREDLALHTSVGDLVVTDAAVYWTDADAGKLYVIAIGGAP